MHESLGELEIFYVYLKRLTKLYVYVLYIFLYISYFLKVVYVF